MSTGTVLHGGARRLPTHVVAGDGRLPQPVSWYEIAPGDACTMHVHEGKTETWLVVAGTGEARIGAAALAVGPGDMMITRAGTPHGLRNTGSEPLRFVNIVALAGSGPVTTREISGP